MQLIVLSAFGNNSIMLSGIRNFGIIFDALIKTFRS